MHWLKSHFRYTKQQRSGIFFLVLLVVVVQGVYLVVRWTPDSQQKQAFRLDNATQKQIDSLKQLTPVKKQPELRPFNPNFITDFKGYTLGMSTIEIDRLHAFRAQNNYVNSAEEFQRVTQVSDTLLKRLAPLFKFPEWRNNKGASSDYPLSKNKYTTNSVSKEVQDLNLASAEDLQTISGIGEVLSNRIVRFRNSLGGFLVNEQLLDVYGLEPSVVKRALERFQVLRPPEIKKININTASVLEIASLTYLNVELAQSIVNYREAHGKYESFEDLFNVSGFPINKIDRIALYLSY